MKELALLSCFTCEQTHDEIVVLSSTRAFYNLNRVRSVVSTKIEDFETWELVCPNCLTQHDMQWGTLKEVLDDSYYHKNYGKCLNEFADDNCQGECSQ